MVIIIPRLHQTCHTRHTWAGQDAPRGRQFCVEDGSLLEIVFFWRSVTFLGYQFLTDFDSQNRCLCSIGDRMGHCYVHFALNSIVVCVILPIYLTHTRTSACILSQCSSARDVLHSRWSTAARVCSEAVGSHLGYSSACTHVLAIRIRWSSPVQVGTSSSA